MGKYLRIILAVLIPVLGRGYARYFFKGAEKRVHCGKACLFRDFGQIHLCIQQQVLGQGNFPQLHILYKPHIHVAAEITAHIGLGEVHFVRQLLQRYIPADVPVDKIGHHFQQGVFVFRTAQDILLITDAELLGQICNVAAG